MNTTVRRSIMGMPCGCLKWTVMFGTLTSLGILECKAMERHTEQYFPKNQPIIFFIGLVEKTSFTVAT